jgi:hypothetical protein
MTPLTIALVVLMATFLALGFYLGLSMRRNVRRVGIAVMASWVIALGIGTGLNYGTKTGFVIAALSGIGLSTSYVQSRSPLKYSHLYNEKKTKKEWRNDQQAK